VSSNHDQRHAAEDHRNEAVMRARALVDYDRANRDRIIARLVGVLVQRPEPHHFHECPVTPISPRRGWGWPAPPGGIDNTGFSDGTV
jgi:hypothetical protein